MTDTATLKAITDIKSEINKASDGPNLKYTEKSNIAVKAFAGRGAQRQTNSIQRAIKDLRSQFKAHPTTRRIDSSGLQTSRARAGATTTISPSQDSPLLRLREPDNSTRIKGTSSTSIFFSFSKQAMTSHAQRSLRVIPTGNGAVAHGQRRQGMQRTYIHRRDQESRTSARQRYTILTRASLVTG